MRVCRFRQIGINNRRANAKREAEAEAEGEEEGEGEGEGEGERGREGRGVLGWSTRTDRYQTVDVGAVNVGLGSCQPRHF